MPLDYSAAARLLGALGRPNHEQAEVPGADFPAVKGYTIHERIGGGGGGVVYRATKEGSDRPLALKIMAAPGPDGSGRARLDRAWRELEALESIRLPCVPRVIDYGTHDGSLYIAAELIDGLPLHQYCSTADRSGLEPGAAEGPGMRGGALRLDDRVRLLARVADAVHSLHERGIIHRDLKPSNILIDREGQPVIIDLGLAHLLNVEQETLTAEGMPLGTPAFMSPEQARGQRDLVSTRSDVYSLGATAYLILTGEPPHGQADSLHETIRRVAQDPARDPCTLEPSLPRALSAVLLKACQPDPQGRYASAAELAADLRRYLSGEPVEAQRPTAWQRAARWIGRHPIATTVAVCAALAVIIVGGAIGLVWYVNTRPSAAAVINREAVLLSPSGNVLHRWSVEEFGEPFFTAIGEQPGPDGKRLAIVAFGFGSTRRAFQVTAFDATHPRQMVWSLGDREPRIVRPYRQASKNELPDRDVQPDTYRPRHALLADVFPERPGPELIVVFRHREGGDNCIRVYDLHGEVQYEAWHFGDINSLQWLAEPGLLVLAGASNRGFPDQPGNVLFALQPKQGFIGEWVNQPAGCDPSKVVTPEWYQELQQEGAPIQLSVVIVSPDIVGRPATPGLRVSVSVMGTDFNYTQLMDCNGDAAAPGWLSTQLASKAGAVGAYRWARVTGGLK